MDQETGQIQYTFNEEAPATAEPYATSPMAAPLGQTASACSLISVAAAEKEPTNRWGEESARDSMEHHAGRYEAPFAIAGNEGSSWHLSAKPQTPLCGARPPPERLEKRQLSLGDARLDQASNRPGTPINSDGTANCSPRVACFERVGLQPSQSGVCDVEIKMSPDPAH